MSRILVVLNRLASLWPTALLIVGVVATFAIGWAGHLHRHALTPDLLKVWAWYAGEHEAVIPLASLIGGGVAAWVAIRQLDLARQQHEAQASAALEQIKIAQNQYELQTRTALDQIKLAQERHDEQTKADKRRRIVESLSKAIEQLGSDKLQVRIGGIYTLERIYTEESYDDYRVIVEILTALVREGSHSDRKISPGSGIDLTSQYSELPGDVATAMTVLKRRPEWGRRIEIDQKMSLDFRGSNLSRIDFRLSSQWAGFFLRIDLNNANLEQSDFSYSKCESVNFFSSKLSGASFMGTKIYNCAFSYADIKSVNFSFADLHGVYFFSANLSEAHFEFAQLNNVEFANANLRGANFLGADFTGAKLNGADLTNAFMFEAKNLTLEQLADAKGNRATRLPDYIKDRPKHWDID